MDFSKVGGYAGSGLKWFRVKAGPCFSTLWGPDVPKRGPVAGDVKSLRFRAAGPV